MTIAVIGRGLVGSAAARHLANAGHDVLLVGPSEPVDLASHDGVFGSHYDEGRITRGLDPYPFWSRVSRASIARYGEIAEASGVSFFTEVGILMAGPEDGRAINDVGRIAAATGIPCERLDGDGLRYRFPSFSFPEDTIGFFEAGNAGYISPRRLVKAQGIAAERAGARIVDAQVTGLSERRQTVEIETARGPLRADRVLVATGGFTNGLLGDLLPLQVYARTVALFEVDDREAERLRAMPSMIYLMPSGEDPYLLPPIRYPDGKTYLKLGGDPADVPLPTDEARRDWFRSGGSADVGRMLTERMRERIPDLAIRSVLTRPCVTTYTPTNHPIIDRLSPRIAVAVGGCGRAAKTSDELGRLGGEAVLGRCEPGLSLAACAEAGKPVL